jgi:hypothetical protein
MKAPKTQPAIWNRLRINGAPLPGIVQSVTVGGNLRMDVSGVAGQDGVVIGNADWSEDTAQFELIVPANELARVQEFRSAYKNKPGIKPTPVVVDHPILREMGIQKMILTRLEIRWDVSMKNRVPVMVQLTNITPKKEADATAVNAEGFITPTNPPTSPPNSSKPGSTGLTESNEITGQPSTPTVTKPTVPGPKR